MLLLGPGERRERAGPVLPAGAAAPALHPPRHGRAAAGPYNLEKWFFLFFRFQNKYFSKNETSILFYFLRAFQCFLQILKIRVLSRVMSKIML